MSGHRIELHRFGRLERLAVVPGIVDGWNDPEIAFGIADKSVYANHGERVVQGHRLMQSASDVFLGWTEGRQGRHYFIRQLRDAKIKFAIEAFGSAEMMLFAECCG